MKALEKDRRRRYETANDFAADVMRHLTDQPVEACPPSAWYRFAKFARRNRAALTTAAVVGAGAGRGHGGQHLAGDPRHAGRHAGPEQRELAGRAGARGAERGGRVEGRPPVPGSGHAGGVGAGEGPGTRRQGGRGSGQRREEDRHGVSGPAPGGGRRAPRDWRRPATPWVNTTRLAARLPEPTSCAATCWVRSIRTR